ncbi:response regulator [Natronorubrum halophilum]|uniref:response regulator n=1 Tax=Natronorubrum halophilum TaxID=1702106 RepID=UPI000EF730A3|nr:response regulator [Natronorubrum halophilum]
MTVTEEQAEQPIDILLVEPNPGDTRLFTENLRDAKLLNTIYAVSDGESALDFVHQRGDHTDKPQPDVILLEPQLPDRDGMDVLAELNDEPALSEIPVIVLTSSDAGERIVKSHDIDADTYIQKPVSAEDFADFVRSIEEFWFTIVRNPSSTTE